MGAGRGPTSETDTVASAPVGGAFAAVAKGGRPSPGEVDVYSITGG